MDGCTSTRLDLYWEIGQFFCLACVCPQLNNAGPHPKMFLF